MANKATNRQRSRRPLQRLDSRRLAEEIAAHLLTEGGTNKKVRRRVRPLRLKVTQSQMNELKTLKQPARAIDYARIIGANKAAMLVSANFHGRRVEAHVGR